MFANVFKILNDHFQLLDGEDVLQSIKDDREQEQKDKETDTNNYNDNILFAIEMANVNNDEIIKKGSNQSEEVSEVDILDTCRKWIVMNYYNFFEISRGVSQAKYTAKKPKLEYIQSVKFDKESGRMFWRTSQTRRVLQFSISPKKPH